MPTYEYACEACGHRFEKFQSIKSEPIKLCPQCGKKKVRRLIGTGAGIIFKGSGFYCTDYRSPSYSASAKSEAAPAGGAAPAKTEASSASTSPTTSSSSASPATPAPAKAEAKKG